MNVSYELNMESTIATATCFLLDYKRVTTVKSAMNPQGLRDAARLTFSDPFRVVQVTLGHGDTCQST